MKTLITKSEAETKEVAKGFTKAFLKNGGVVGLFGQLGSGKTTFVQAVGSTLGIKEKILSPTFIFIRNYQLAKLNKTLFHIDLYRLEGSKDLENLGLREIFENPNNIVVVEWAEKLGKLLPKDTIKIKFEILDKNTRRLLFWHNQKSKVFQSEH